jgi:hypothetical protein
MKGQPEPRIISVDRLSGSVVITFADGKSALYSASLLHGTLLQAEELEEGIWLNESENRRGQPTFDSCTVSKV